jgi:uncharacterized membrane protein
MTQEMYYSRLLPIIALIYVAILFLLEWNSTAVIVGGLVVGIFALAGSFITHGQP